MTTVNIPLRVNPALYNEALSAYRIAGIEVYEDTVPVLKIRHEKGAEETIADLVAAMLLAYTERTVAATRENLVERILAKLALMHPDGVNRIQREVRDAREEADADTPWLDLFAEAL